VTDSPADLVGGMLDRSSQVIGNDKMFGVRGQDVRSQLAKYKINIRQNLQYDELGSLQLLSTLVQSKKIKIYSNCRDIIRQMTDWSYNGYGKQQLHDEFGLCYALLNVISKLRRRIELNVPTQIPMDTGYDNSTSVRIVNPVTRWVVR
jgi:hypothetical protein